MDNHGDLYVSNCEKNEVRRCKLREKNDKGNDLNHLSNPTYLFVDQDHSVYISDEDNECVMKGAEEGIFVGDGQSQGHRLTQLSFPSGVIVDHSGNVYVTDYGNDRIMCWLKGRKEESHCRWNSKSISLMGIELFLWFLLRSTR